MKGETNKMANRDTDIEKAKSFLSKARSKKEKIKIFRLIRRINKVAFDEGYKELENLYNKYPTERTAPLNLYQFKSAKKTNNKKSSLLDLD